MLLEFRVSHIGIVTSLLLYSAALIALWLSNVLEVWQWLLSALILADAALLARRTFSSRLISVGPLAIRLPSAGTPSIKALRLGYAQCEFVFENTVAKTSFPQVIYYSEYLLILRFKMEALKSRRPRGRTLVLFPDSLSASDDRSLRRYLRFRLPDADSIQLS